jgi:hypothetical protein
VRYLVVFVCPKHASKMCIWTGVVVVFVAFEQVNRWVTKCMSLTTRSAFRFDNCYHVSLSFSTRTCQPSIRRVGAKKKPAVLCGLLPAVPTVGIRSGWRSLSALFDVSAKSIAGFSELLRDSIRNSSVPIVVPTRRRKKRARTSAFPGGKLVRASSCWKMEFSRPCEKCQLEQLSKHESQVL